MKRIFFIIFAIIGLVVSASHFTACEKYIIPQLSFTPDTLKCGLNNGAYDVTIHSTVAWRVSSGSNWIEPSVKSGKKDSVIQLYINASDSTRLGSLTVTTETLEKRIIVLQQAGL
jgi:hypothetical protein